MAEKQYILFGRGQPSADALETQSDYWRFGYSKNDAEVKAAYETALGKQDRDTRWQMVDDLAKGAWAAFEEGRPTAIQTLFQKMEHDRPGPFAKLFGDGEYRGIRFDMWSVGVDDVLLATEKMDPQRLREISNEMLVNEHCVDHFLEGASRSHMNKIYLALGADVRAGDNIALREAAKEKDTAFVKELLEKGADMNHAILHARLDGQDNALRNLRIYQEELGQQKPVGLDGLRKEVAKLTKLVNRRFGKKEKEPEEKPAPKKKQATKRREPGTA
jgi:hypothetical protein